MTENVWMPKCNPGVQNWHPSVIITDFYTIERSISTPERIFDGNLSMNEHIYKCGIYISTRWGANSYGWVFSVKYFCYLYLFLIKESWASNANHIYLYENNVHIYTLNAYNRRINQWNLLNYLLKPGKQYRITSYYTCISEVSTNRVLLPLFLSKDNVEAKFYDVNKWFII